jgi:hypothetical protein
MFYFLQDAEIAGKPLSGGLRKLGWSSMKYILLLVILPPFINYAALQKETTELKPPGKN